MRGELCELYSVRLNDNAPICAASGG